MDKFKRPYSNTRSHGPSSGRPSFGAPGARPKFGYSGGEFRHEAPVKKYDAICSTCGRRCEVPFRPDGSRPVYCTECFGAPHDANANAGKGKFPSRDFSPRPSYGAPAGGKSLADLERQIGAMNTKIDTMLRILESMQPHTAIADAVSIASIKEVAPFKKAPSFPVPPNVTALRKPVKKASFGKKPIRKSGGAKRK